MKHYLHGCRSILEYIHSPQAECDCLSTQVQKHLSKLFDNMAKIQFKTDGEGNSSETGLGMYSKEEEYVPFSYCCECTGQVNWFVIFKWHIHLFRVEIGLIIIPIVGLLLKIK